MTELSHDDRERAIMLIQQAVAELRLAGEILQAKQLSTFVGRNGFTSLIARQSWIGPSIESDDPRRLVNRLIPPAETIAQERAAAERLRLAACEYAYG
jgi:hypothetical protein